MDGIWDINARFLMVCSSTSRDAWTTSPCYTHVFQRFQTKPAESIAIHDSRPQVLLNDILLNPEQYCNRDPSTIAWLKLGNPSLTTKHEGENMTFRATHARLSQLVDAHPTRALLDAVGWWPEALFGRFPELRHLGSD